MRQKLVGLYAKLRAWVQSHVPPGYRWLVGLILILLGFLGFLPVLGFWMIPLGIAVAAMDVRYFMRWLKVEKGDDHEN